MRYKFFTILKFPSKILVELLKKNIIGTPGKSMLYQHLEVQKKLNFISDPYYVNLSKGDDVIGTCCFCSRSTLNSSRLINSFYLRYFTFKSSYRTKFRVASKIARKQSFLRKEINQLLDGDGLGDRASGSFFHYAYVDPENYRSALLCNEFGFEPVRTFSTVIFHRMNPQPNLKIEKISTAHISQVKEILTNFYKGYNMFSFENLFRLSDYYIIRDDNGNMVAGAQATPDNWKVLELPGINGKIILNLFSSLPYFSKLIKKKYRFISLEGIFVTPGHEKVLEQLFESLLSINNRNSAMLWLDRDTQLYRTIKSLKLGVLNTINKEVTANVICRFQNIDDDNKIIFKNNPAYISGIDLT